MGGNAVTQPTDESSSLNPTAMKTILVEPRESLSSTISFVAENTTTITDEHDTNNSHTHVIHEGTKNVVKDSNKNQIPEIDDHNTTQQGTTNDCAQIDMTNIDTRTDLRTTSCGNDNIKTQPVIANDKHEQSPSANSDIVASIPQHPIVDVPPVDPIPSVDIDGNDRVSHDAPPNVSLNTKVSIQSHHIVDINRNVQNHNISEANTNSGDVVVAADKNIVESWNQHNPSTLGIGNTSAPTSNNVVSISTIPQSSSLLNTVTNMGVVRVNTEVQTSTISNTALCNPIVTTSTLPTLDSEKVAIKPTKSSALNSSNDSHVSTPPAVQQTAQQVAEEEAIAALRAPLVNLYGSYLCHSKDTSLSDARKRLRNAIKQTRSLRQTFTERVYGKYRVCLRLPPTAEDIISKIEADPVAQFRLLKEEIAGVREEKEIEKKEAAKLNSEMNQSSSGERAPVLSNIDNAEQLMFLTAGLNLVLLPEEQTEEQLRAYAESYTTNIKTGRSRGNISQAAATAGEVILDRTRKAAAMRVERQRRRQLQLLRGEVVADGESENNYSRLQVLKIAESSTNLINVDGSSKKPPSIISEAKPPPISSTRRSTTSSGKIGRSRVQVSLPTSTLLSLNPSADEVKIEGNPTAATAALIARGVGQTVAKTTQQRLRHPHPESLGGRRRANINPGAPKRDDDLSQPHEPFLQSNLANTLPPLPASKERLERKRLPEESIDTPSILKARQSVKSVLSHFIDSSDETSLKPISKINLLNGMRKQTIDSTDSKLSQLCGESGKAINDAVVDQSGRVDASQINHDVLLHPALTISVLYALGIVGRTPECQSQATCFTPDINMNNKALCSDKLLALKGKICSVDSTLTIALQRRKEATNPSEMIGRKRTRSSNSEIIELPSNVTRLEGVLATDEGDLDFKSTSIDVSPAQEILDSERKSMPQIEKPVKDTSVKNEAHPKKRARSSSSPTRTTSLVSRLSSEQVQAQVLASTNAMTALSTTTPLTATTAHFAQSAAINMNVFQFANQLSHLHHLHHPSAGDLAEYLGSVQQQQQTYDLHNLLSGNVSSPLSVYGLLQPTPSFAGYTLQERAAAARSMLLREQHAAAILGGYQMQSQAAFTQLQPHPFSLGQTLPTLISHTGLQVQGPVDYSTVEPAAASYEPMSTVVSKKSNQQATDQNGTIADSVVETLDPQGKNNVSSDEINKNRKEDTDAVETRDTAKKLTTCDTNKCGGMQFVAPNPPPSLTSKHVEQIQIGLFHLVAEDNEQDIVDTALDYLLLVGSSIPIPRGLVLTPLKDRLNTPGFKNSGNSSPLITRDVVTACILIWLWATQEQTFQHAFKTHGRIDVDPDCKWLIQAAVDTAVGELSLEIAESLARGDGPFAEANTLRKSHPTTSSDQSTSIPEVNVATRKIDITTASIVSKALSAEMCINSEMNGAVQVSSLLINFLDEARLGALRCKSQERTLLATLLARNTFLSENFSHAYVSAMVRAGEALKPSILFDVAQDEDVKASSMMPYDIFSDDTGAWEDPCKPESGFTSGLCGEDLMKRSHARAIIHKSLRKLQDRHHIRGGTTLYGPFVDSEVDSSRSNTGSNTKERPSVVPQRSGIKRRVSSMMEPPIVPGSGSAPAKSWAVYHPRHSVTPLEWDQDAAENTPYGSYARSRFASISNRRNEQDTGGISRLSSVTIQDPSVDRKFHRSTSEIEWGDVASTFQSVEVPKKSSRYKAVEHETHVAVDGVIFAPHYGEIDGEIDTDDHGESDSDDEEEDLTEATVLARHQLVLDGMKAKLEAYLEARKKQQERRKNKLAK